jgi:signal transduction histidine kinase
MGNMLLVGSHSRGLLAVEGDEVREILSRPRAFFVEAIAIDARGRPWFGAQTTDRDSGLFQSADLIRPQKLAMNTGTVTALAFDPQGALWAGTEGQGAFTYGESHKLEHFTFENTAGGLRSNHIYAVFVDREGVVWFGTDRGACRYDPRSLRIETVSIHRESNFTRALFQSRDGWIWCGTNRGLFVRSAKAEAWHEIKELQGKTVHSIAEDAPEHLLVGTASGLFTGIKPTTKQRRAHGISGPLPGDRLFSRIEPADETGATGDSVRAICEFQGSFYIASFGRGLERLERDRHVLVWPGQSAVSLHSDNDKRLWIGTAGDGVFVFDGREVRREAALDSMSGKTAWSIGGSSDGTLWLATPDGLNAYRSGQLLTLLEGNDVRKVIARANTAWCVTAGGGLYRILIDDGGGPVIARLGAEQGLPSQNAFAILATTEASGDEVLWIGTNRGVARYIPGHIAPQLRVARVMSKRLFQPEEIHAGLSLDYPQSGLLVDLEAFSSRTFPEQFQYSFSLYDSHGKLLGHKLARDSQFLIENLRPGRYRVEARAFTNDLAASEPFALDFQVARAPFPWASSGLAVLLALALVAMWWGRRQNLRLTRTNVALGDANLQLADTRMQLANETEAERRRISRDLHDQTLADLRRLLLLTDQLPARENENGRETIDPAVLRGEVETISTEIRRICEDLSPSTLSNVGLAAALEWAIADAVAHMPSDHRFEYEFVCDDAIEERLRLAPAEQIQIYRILQEAISNTCHHSNATHVRLVVTSETDGGWAIELEDNGSGFDVGCRVSMGRGLANIRSRASLIQAEVEWSGGRGGGTIFTLQRAAKRNHE